MTKNASPLQKLRCNAQRWLQDRPKLEAVLWFLAALGLIALLVWFLAFSNFGAPPEFVYQQF